MKRPDLDTLACVNAECQLFRHAGANNLVIRKVYGHDSIRLLRCRTCGEEFSERRGTALFNTKLPEATAADVINHLGEGCSVRATARLVKVAKETVARLLRVTGWHAERFHEQHVHDLTPKALVHDAKRRLCARHLPAIFTDAYPGYESALLEAFGRRYPTPRLRGKGRAPRFVLRWPQGLAYGQVKKQYKGRRVERVEVRAISGKARLQHILSVLGYKAD